MKLEQRVGIVHELGLAHGHVALELDHLGRGLVTRLFQPVHPGKDRGAVALAFLFLPLIEPGRADQGGQVAGAETYEFESWSRNGSIC